MIFCCFCLPIFFREAVPSLDGLILSYYLNSYFFWIQKIVCPMIAIFILISPFLSLMSLRLYRALSNPLIQFK